MPRQKAGSGGASRTGITPVSPYEQLKRGIAAGEFAPGFPLVEATLADMFGISRTPIREALTRLEQDGLVLRTDRGLVVWERSPEEILDIYDVRVLLAGLGARLAAERRTVLDLIRIRTRLETLSQMGLDDLAALMETNRSVLRSIWKASRSKPIEETMDRLSHQITARYPVTTLSVPGRLEETVEEHTNMLRAIEAQDGDAAAAAAVHHFTRTRATRLAMWAASQKVDLEGRG
jgi:DNA-binding GntR family transcriptional regulator